METDYEYINTVKEQRDINTKELIGYLVNGSMSVPIAEGNRHYKHIQEWLKINTPEPAFNLDDLKSHKKQEIKSAFNASFKNGYTCSNDITTDAYMENITLFDSGVRLANNLGNTDIIVRDFNNDSHTISITDAQTMVNELGANWQTQWQKKIDLQSQIDGATNEAELEAITWI